MEPHDGILRGRLANGPVHLRQALRGVDEITVAVRSALEHIESDLLAQ